MERQSVERKKESANDLKHTSYLIKKGEGIAMAWAFMPASGTSSQIFIDDVAHEGSSGMNSEVYLNNLN